MGLKFGSMALKSKGGSSGLVISEKDRLLVATNMSAFSQKDMTIDGSGMAIPKEGSTSNMESCIEESDCWWRRLG